MTTKQVTRQIMAGMAMVMTLSLTQATLAQTIGGPGIQNNVTGRPDAGDVNKGGKNATVIYANSDGANDRNEFLYFKVYAPGGGSNYSGYDWYTNPTAWMDPYDFHLYNTNLRMYSNFIKFNNAPKNRRIIFDQDTWSTDDYQFTGFGSTVDNSLRYQIKDATKSHIFYAGTGTTNAKTLVTINGNGKLQLPKAGQLEFGAGETKEGNAATISYKLFSDGLDIVGAGTTANNRVIKVWSEKGTSFNGLVSIGSDKNWIHTVPPTTLPGGVDLSSYKLFVDGGVLAREVRVETDWADYVFKPDYQLLPLLEVEKRIRENGHLPGMPSADEIQQNGLNLGAVVKLQQEKIEEMTLHLISMKKELDALRGQMSQLPTVPAK